ncbi:hypothetical protein HYH03_015598 [Edaphochlamys debaryana]|uniref:Uncharacterized protein n=1 Tax=Edaphochlamys debaryana TaxID=47281 RepID=A0A835XLJ9_9CHLO|nr:hypothetical protein HYH03_015598 [Edaphochlamys debaryana]|eukprot:KAG2485714.1 hypothetical protein HYH03_015598 [Edaphochlamys debaryana]
MQQALRAPCRPAALRSSARKQCGRLVVRASVAAPASVDAVVSWAAGKGAKLEKATLGADLLTDKPILTAAADVNAGDVLITVPDSLWISSENVKKTTVGKAAAAASLEPWLQLALQLVADRWGSNKSELAAYAASLPEDLGTPLLWSEEELQELAGTQVSQSLSGYLAFFRATFEQLQSGLFASNPAAFPASVFTLPHFLWAVAAVRCRAHAPLSEGDKIAVVPVADLVSHRRAANSKLLVRGAGLFGRGQTLVVEATRPIRKGEAISMDYGTGQLDGPVLLNHGAMDPSSPKPGYSLTLTLPNTDRFLDDKLDILETNGLSTTMTYPLTPSQQPGQEMMAFLRLFQLKAADAFLLESIFRSDVWGFMQDPVSEGNEADVCAMLSEGARALLAGYPTSLEEDLVTARAMAGDKASRKYAALMIRLGEKEALDALARFFEDRRATGLKRLVYYQERRLRRLGLVDDEGRTTYDSFFKDGIA